MDRNIHTDDFERLLREKSDEFRMYPSKRIWCSIYNNIHPGNKWPSVAMCITLISALLLVGYLNTRNTNQYSGIKKTSVTPLITANTYAKSAIDASSQNYSIESVASSSPKLVTADHNSLSAEPAKVGKDKRLIKQSPSFTNSTDYSSMVSTSTNIAASASKLDLSSSPKEEVIGKENSSFSIAAINNESNTLTDFSQVFSSKPSFEETNNLSPENLDFEQALSINHSFPVFSTTQLNTSNSTDIKISIQKITTGVEELMIGSNKNDLTSLGDKEWIENYALYNRPAPKKWANKLDLQVYATPSVVYRNLYEDANFGNTLNVTPFAISSSGRNLNSSVNQAPSFGFEVGTGLQYAIFRGVKLKSSLQLNYTRYNSHAFQNSHPVATKLTMHNFESNTSYEVFRSTAYSNNSGLEMANLHNETFQISLPIGIDFKLLGNENLEWNIGATIQPTFVAGGKSYLISSDRHNYVKETSMLNRWNLNAGFETFIAYKVNGLTWQIGPQFRKQLFSTNSKTYAVGEKLVNYGFKIGVTKTIR